ncbi:hypothetical protein PPTG_20239, partial [Phytophthora nicotianae INRA-310]
MSTADRPTQYQHVDLARRVGTAKKNGWCDRNGSGVVWFDTKTSIRVHDVDSSTWTTSRTITTQSSVFMTEDDDGERAVSYDEVMKSKYRNEWLRAMESEMESLDNHQTWEL